jgi:hypothetical protein
MHRTMHAKPDQKHLGKIMAGLVEESFTRCRTAEAGNAIQAADLSLKLVVVSQLLVCRHISVSKRYPKKVGPKIEGRQKYTYSEQCRVAHR